VTNAHSDTPTEAASSASQPNDFSPESADPQEEPAGDANPVSPGIATGIEEAVEGDLPTEVSPRLMEATEAMIFAADEPVAGYRIAETFAEVTGQAKPDAAVVEAAVYALNDAYEASGRALIIHEWAGGYRMTTRSNVAPFVKAFVTGEQETSLSRSLLETLAVVAYRQPVTRPEVDFVRGVNSDYAIRKLLDLGLADVRGRSDSLGRPLLYGTTDRFLEQFGLDSLEGLPTLREIEDLLDDPSFDEERAQLLQLDTEKEITDQETAKEVLAEAKESLASGELDPEDLTAAAPGSSGSRTSGDASADDPDTPAPTDDPSSTAPPDASADE